MNEERLVNIEAKITFQEDLIEELNKSVSSNKSWSGLKRFVNRSQGRSNRRLKGMKERLRTKGRRIISVQPPTVRG